MDSMTDTGLSCSCDSPFSISLLDFGSWKAGALVCVAVRKWKQFSSVFIGLEVFYIVAVIYCVHELVSLLFRIFNVMRLQEETIC